MSIANNKKKKKKKNECMSNKIEREDYNKLVLL